MTYDLDPLTGDPIAKAFASAADLDTIALEFIDTMSVDELRTLCRRMACQCGLIARMTQEEIAQAMLDTLAETALKPIVMGLNMRADIQNRIAAIDKWLDRTKGKPSQSVSLAVDAKVEHTHRLELSADLLKEQIQRILHKKPVVIENQ